MKRYEKYKDSDIEWLGKIPADWETSKLKFITNKIIDGTHFTPTYVDAGVPFLRVTDIQSSEIDLSEVKFIPKEEHEELTKRCRPEKGDVLLSKNGTIGITKVVDWDWEFSIFVSLCLIKFTSKLHPNYFTYFFQSSVVDKQINEGSKTTSVTNLHLDKIKELIIAFPEWNVQTAIAAFLDHKTAQIDALIEKKEQLIEKLKTQRQAIINEAVTKGLNPNAPMKDSGIEWLGETPEHWEVVKLKYLVEKVGSGVTPRGGSEVYQEDGIMFLRSQNIYSEELRLDDIAFISEDLDSKMSNSRVKHGDILLNITGASIGRCNYWKLNDDVANVNQHVCIIRPIDLAYTPFIHLILVSDVGQTQIFMGQDGTSREGLTFEAIKNFLVAVPPQKEISNILDLVDSRTDNIDCSILRIKESIAKLKLYRQSLISEAVTGKIDVRDWELTKTN